VIPESAFFLSMAGLSGSFAGLAGLVAGLRRGTGLASVEAFRLRQIVEFSFANVLIATSVIPFGQLTGDPTTMARTLGSVSLGYLVMSVVFLLRRARNLSVWLVGRQRPAVGAIVVVSIGLAIASVASGDIAMLEFLLIALLVRPMTVFLFVLGALHDPPDEPIGEGTASSAVS
jgi:hypothetical protein